MEVSNCGIKFLSTFNRIEKYRRRSEGGKKKGEIEQNYYTSDATVFFIRTWFFFLFNSF